MSELAERFEVLVEAFARKIAALSIDAAEQKGRADRAEAEVDRLRREYEPGYPVARDASVDAQECEHGVVNDTADCVTCLIAERDRLRAELGDWQHRYYLVTDAIAAESTSAEQLADIAHKTRQDLAAANEEIARLHASMKLQRDATKQALDDRDAAHAKLGRAVAALQEARDGISAIYRHIDEDREIKAMKACKPIIDKIDAILADADGTQSAAYVSEMEAVYEAAGQVRRYWGSALGATSEQAALIEALAAVDARRGGGR